MQTDPIASSSWLRVRDGHALAAPNKPIRLTPCFAWYARPGAAPLARQAFYATQVNRAVSFWRSAIDLDPQARGRVEPWWAALTVWAIVNLVCLLQAAGFLSRIATGTHDINRVLGIAIFALAIPASVALGAFARSGAKWVHMAGPASFIAFCLFGLAVERVWPVEFRNPMLPLVLVPYLVLFFGSIVLMGAPMYRISRRRWLVTAVSATILVLSMLAAMRAGVG